MTKIPIKIETNTHKLCLSAAAPSEGSHHLQNNIILWQKNPKTVKFLFWLVIVNLDTKSNSTKQHKSSPESPKLKFSSRATCGAKNWYFWALKRLNKKWNEIFKKDGLQGGLRHLVHLVHIWFNKKNFTQLVSRQPFLWDPNAQSRDLLFVACECRFLCKNKCARNVSEIH